MLPMQVQLEHPESEGLPALPGICTLQSGDGGCVQLRGGLVFQKGVHLALTEEGPLGGGDMLKVKERKSCLIRTSHISSGQGNWDGLMIQLDTFHSSGFAPVQLVIGAVALVWDLVRASPVNNIMKFGTSKFPTSRWVPLSEF